MSNGNTSNWEKASTIATIVEAIVVIASLYFIWSQLQFQTKLTQASNSQSIAGLYLPIGMLLAEHPEMSKLWLKGTKEFAPEVTITDKEIEEDQYYTLIGMFLIFYENAYLQYDKQLLDKDIYDAWNEDLKGFIKEQHLEKYWDKRKNLYHPKFREHVNAVIKNQAAPTP
jgi:hypothetical protein